MSQLVEHVARRLEAGRHLRLAENVGHLVVADAEELPLGLAHREAQKPRPEVGHLHAVEEDALV
eukprot:6189975-Lingulodinium_polyedra.AAC.1